MRAQNFELYKMHIVANMDKMNKTLNSVQALKARASPVGVGLEAVDALLAAEVLVADDVPVPEPLVEPIELVVMVVIEDVPLLVPELLDAVEDVDAADAAEAVPKIPPPIEFGTVVSCVFDADDLKAERVSEPDDGGLMTPTMPASQCPGTPQ